MPEEREWRECYNCGQDVPVTGGGECPYCGADLRIAEEVK